MYKAQQKLESAENIFDRAYGVLLKIVTLFTRICGVNFMLPYSFSWQTTFSLLDNVHLSEEDRCDMLEVADSWPQMLLGHMDRFADDNLKRNFSFAINAYCTQFRTLVEWKSGHTENATCAATLCIEKLSLLKAANMLATFAKCCYPSMLTLLVVFFHEQGKFNLAKDVCGYVSDICEIIKPCYDTLQKLISDFISLKLETSTTPSVFPTSSNTNLPLDTPQTNNSTPTTDSNTQQPSSSCPTELPVVHSGNIEFSFLDANLSENTLNVEEWAVNSPQSWWSDSIE